MKLYLVRHAFAGVRLKDDAADSARKLAPEGVSQATAVGEYLVDMRQSPKLIVTSTTARAKQTGDCIADATGSKVQTDKDLDPGGNLADWIWYNVVKPGVKGTMVVTHSDLLQTGWEKLTGEEVEPWVMGEVRLYSVNKNSENWPLVWRMKPGNVGIGFQDRL